MMSSAAVERASSPDAKRPRIEAKDGPSRKQLPAEAVAGPSKPRATERKRKIRRLLPDPYSAQDVMWHDVRDFLGHDYVYEAIAKGVEWDPPIALFDTLEVRVGVFTVSGTSRILSDIKLTLGESLALVERDGRKWALLVPFAHPGDLVRCKVFKHDRLHSTADLIQTLEYNEADRGGQGDRRKYPDQGCRYFGEWCGLRCILPLTSSSGCQLQPIPYELQLAHKHRTVQLAYDRFSGLTASAVPPIQPTIGSPKQWGYRTKITPHFGAPPPWLKTKMSEEGAMNSLDGEFEQDGRSWACAIGFERKGKPGVMDIEVCRPIRAVAERVGVPNSHCGPQRENGRGAGSRQEVSADRRAETSRLIIAAPSHHIHEVPPYFSVTPCDLQMTRRFRSPHHPLVTSMLRSSITKLPFTNGWATSYSPSLRIVSSKTTTQSSDL